METAGTVRSSQLPVQSMADLKALGDMLATSGMFGCENAGQGMVLAMTCLQTGMTPLEFNRNFHIIEGKPSMRADAMLAHFVERGGKFIITERSATRAAAVFSKGDNRLEVEFTMADAERAGLTKNSKGQLKHNWQAFPKAMLWARLVSDTIRAIDPGVNFGTYTPEEVQDFDERPAPKNVTPPQVFSQPRATAPVQPPAPKAEVLPPESVAVPSSSPAAAPAAPVDPGVAPFGKNAGKPWSDPCFSDAALKAVIATEDPRITSEMKQACRIVLGQRLQAKGETA